MTLLKYTIATLLLFSFFKGVTQNNNGSTRTESLIFKGAFTKADSLLNFQLENTTDFKEKTSLYHYKGDISKLKGDIDDALKNWLLSNKNRTRAYSEDDYHLA